MQSESTSWVPQHIERHPDEWVCLVEIDRIEENDFEFRTARVAGHDKTRREPLDQAWPLRIRYEEIGHYYPGRIVAPLPRFL